MSLWPLTSSSSKHCEQSNKVTTIADTLACDKVLISALQQNHDYDYDRELAAQQPSLWDWLVAQFNEWLDRLLGNSVSVGLRNAILVFIGISVVGLIVWFLYKYRPELFRRSRTEGDADADDGEDTIYGIDFDAEISRARVAGDYRQAVRYLYLKTLRRLSDTGRIDWQPSKTPSHAETHRRTET